MNGRNFLFSIIFLISVSFNASASEALQTALDECVPKNYHWIMQKIFFRESSHNPIALNINKGQGYIKRQPKSLYEAQLVVNYLLSKNINFDIGIGQINSQHFQENRIFNKMGYRATDALDICTNIKMATFLFEDAYKRTGRVDQALSIYNTGDPFKGIKNGYVEKVLGASR